MMAVKTARRLGRGFLYGASALTVLASIPAFRESVLLGSVLIAPPVIYLLVRMLFLTGKSIWGISFFLFAAGALELYTGYAKGLPFSWAIALFVLFFGLVFSFFKAARTAWQAFDDSMPQRDWTRQRREGDDSLYEDSPNGRGGIYPQFTKGDALGNVPENMRGRS